MPNHDVEADRAPEREVRPPKGSARQARPHQGRSQQGRPLQRHLLGTMFDTTRVVERALSTGTVVRLRIEELDGETVMVHEAWRRRGDGNWNRWREIEGEQSAQEIRLDLCRDVNTARID